MNSTCQAVCVKRLFFFLNFYSNIVDLQCVLASAVHQNDSVLHIYIYVCVCVCVCVHLHTHMCVMVVVESLSNV